MGILHNFAFQLNLLTFGSKDSWKSFVGHTKLFYENLGKKHRVQQKFLIFKWKKIVIEMKKIYRIK